MIKGIHYFSGLTIAVYVAVHMLNHLLILHSEALHIRFMQAARRVYRQPVVEGVLMTAVAVQILSGMFLITRKFSKAEGWFDWLQMGSGLYLALFLTNHVRAVLVGRHKMRVDTDLYYGAGVMNVWPQRLFYIPYYTLAIFSFFAHAACIHRIKMAVYLSGQVAEEQALGILVLGCVIALLIISRMSHLNMPAELRRRDGAD